jgi:glucans biosynthesis protein
LTYPSLNLARPDRRRIVAGLVSAASLPVVGRASAQTQTFRATVESALGDGQSFAPASVVDLARSLAKRPFSPPATDLPEPFANLNYERYVAMQMRPEQRLWASENRGFIVEPLPRGFVFTTGVGLFVVEDAKVRRIAYDRDAFDFGDLAVPANGPDLGFSGFRLYGRDGADASYLFAIVQGATFLRGMAKGQNFGIIGRALTLKPAEQKGEEFPAFRAFWFETPPPGSNALVVHGLIESESVTGAVRITMRPGDTTIFDLETTLFPRVALEHVGLGGGAASFLFSPNVRVTQDDLRPGSYEASGLSIQNGRGEWIWRPLNNPGTLQISAFIDENPRGFGLLQRDRNFDHYQDDAQRFETRPSLWIEPIGDWGAGAVQLIEIPSDAEVNKNILAYWRPKAPIAPGQEFSFAYRQFWAWQSPSRPALAQVTATRSGRGGPRRRRFLVEFQGDALGTRPADLRPALSSSPGSITNIRVWTYPERKTVRVAFDLEYGSETACEMRLVLESGERPLSETWLYRWTT